MKLPDKLKALEAEELDSPPQRNKHVPKGWEPGVTWEGSSGGTITTGTLETPPDDWDDLLRERGLDPARYEIVGDTIKWCSYDGWKRDAVGEGAYSAICFSYRANIRLRVAAVRENDASLEALYIEARKQRPARSKRKSGEETFVVALSDWQTGNSDFEGVNGQIEAIADLPEKICDQLADHRRSGHQIGTVVLAGLGDLVENTCDFYPSQAFTVDLDRREQTRVVRRGLRDIVLAVSKQAEKVSVVAIPGNHGENRKNGKAYTTVNDNDDVAVFEQVAEIIAASEAIENVGFRLAGEEVVVAIRVSDQTIAFTHGHVPKPRNGAVPTLWEWWKEHAMGRAIPALADADILIAGHFHHLNVKEQEGRLILIAPSLTKVGQYWANAHGTTTAAGTLSLIVSPDGWGGLNIL